MAAVTMLFLPGAFISVRTLDLPSSLSSRRVQSVFSTVFFNSYVDTSGTFHVVVAPQWWLFLAVTAPLTLLVFVLWKLLKKRRFQDVIAGRGEDVEHSKQKHKQSLSDLTL